MLLAEQIKGYRLSFQQEDQWLLQQAQAETLFRVQCALGTEGGLDLILLRHAVRNLLQRHEILRTVFRLLPGMTLPLQVIVDSGSVSLAVHDLSTIDFQSHTIRQETLWRQMSAQRFDWECGPLADIRVVRLGDNRHRLVIKLSALCADRLTLKNLVQELGALYEGGLLNHSADAGVQYADFAEWQHELLANDRGNAIRFWREQISFEPRHVKLPFEQIPARPEFSPGSMRVVISEEQVRACNSLAQKEKLPLETLLLTAWLSLLHRHSGQAELLAGVASDCRNEHLEGAIGPYERFLPVRFALDKDQPFVEAARGVHEAVETMRVWKDYFSWSAITDSARTPTIPAYFPFAFAYEQKLDDYRGGAISLVFEKVYACTDQFKLKLVCTESAKSFDLSIHFDTAVFSREAVACLADQLGILIGSAIEQPEQPIGRLPMLSETARRKVVFDFNQTRVDYPGHPCLHQLIEAQAEKTSNAVAVAFASQYLSYGELNRRANRLANYLRATGVGPNTLIGIYLDRSPEVMLGILGVLKAGAAYVPMDPAYPEGRIAYVLKDAEISLVLSKEALRGDFPSTAQEIICLDQNRAIFDSYSEATPTVLNRPNDLCYVIYTSGSTGLPKGVAIRHQNAVHSTFARLVYYDQPVKSFLLLSSFAFDSSVAGIFWTLSQGGRLCLPEDGELDELAALAALVEREQVSHLLSLPSLYKLLLEQLGGQNAASLSTVIVAGEPCRGDLAARHHRRLAGVRLFNEYGPTEGTVWSSVYESRPSDSSDSLPIGRPIANTRIYLLDDALNPVPVGIPGQIYIAGEGLATGYLNRPEPTAEKFIPERFADIASARLYRTGDIARFRPDGTIEFLGRSDYQVKLRGYRIELGEIEARLCEHPQVHEAVVLVREEDTGDKRLVAYVAGRQDRLPEQDGLRSYLKRILPDYMIPSVFVFLPALPLSPNGKIDRQRLVTIDLTEQSTARYAAPRTRNEKALADLWKDMLRVQRVGVHDSFFDLGGVSLLSIQMVSRARQAGVFLTPRQVYQHKTIGALAAIAESTASHEPGPEAVSGEVPLTPIQHWFFANNLSNPRLWTHSLLMQLTQPVNSAYLEATAAHLVARHDALRMRFTKEVDGWRQVNLAEVPLSPFRQVDLSGVAPHARREMMEAIAKSAESIDIEQGMLFRIILFYLGEAQPGYLLIVIHHLVADGLSWRILLEDLQMAYRQLTEGQEIVLAKKTASFKQWSESLLEYVKSDEVRQEAKFWIDWLSTDIHALPVENPSGDNTEASSKTMCFTLDGEETRQLVQEAPALWRCGIDDLLLTALALTVSRWSGERRILVDMDRHGREHFLEGMDISRTVGWFTSLAPVLLEVHPEDPTAQALLSVQRQLDKIPHKGFHYGLLRYLEPESSVTRELKKLPSAQLIFNYLGQLDQVVSESSPFALSDEHIRRGFDPAWVRPYELAVDGYVYAGRLHLSWEYSVARYCRSTIERLGQGFSDTLQKFLIKHSQNP